MPGSAGGGSSAGCHLRKLRALLQNRVQPLGWRPARWSRNELRRSGCIPRAANCHTIVRAAHALP